MAMRIGSASFRHIVDVDGQLHGIEKRSVDARALLRLAGHDDGRELYQVRGDLMVALEPGRAIGLCEDEVAFFRSVPSAAHIALRLAA